MSITPALINEKLRHLRIDGLFAEAVEVTENGFTLLVTTYVTDVDEEGDCLCVDPSVEHAGDGPCEVCASFTAGLVKQPERCSYKCPCCNRYSKPRTMIPRHKFHVFMITSSGTIEAASGMMSPQMIQKIIGAWTPLDDEIEVDINFTMPLTSPFEAEDKMWGGSIQ